MSAISQCGACNLVFVSVKAFDAHRTGPYTRGGRRCLTPSELQAKGMVQDEKGRWRLPEEASEASALTA
ncbi:MAG TPA: hypothetical protein VKV37_10315 [Ktedonobacteraceae bacterium]|nr:hypothetical protein [Ktedonobacteraceae bacterium]